MKWILGVVLLFIVGGLWWSGMLAELSDADSLRVRVADAGIAGPLVFVGIVTLLFPVFLAGPPIWLSGSIWPIPLAIVYSAIASTVASVLFYALARWLGRDWAAGHIPERVREYEARLEQYPYRTIAVLRVLLWINPAVDILIGVSGVSTRAYLLGSAAVLGPLTVLHVTLPAKGIALAGEAPEWLGPAAGVALVIGIAIWLVRRRRAVALATAASEVDSDLGG